MVTTIQIDEKTLMILKKLKHELKAASYDETIRRIAVPKEKKSLAGSLKKYYKDKSLKEILKELQEERRKSDRF